VAPALFAEARAISAKRLPIKNNTPPIIMLAITK